MKVHSIRKSSFAAVAAALLLTAGGVGIYYQIDKPSNDITKKNMVVQSVQIESANNAAMQSHETIQEKKKKNICAIHKVSAGETLSSIADKYNIDVETIAGANQSVEEIIQPGQELVILPGKGVLHVVRRGETLWGISRTYGINMQTIIHANDKKDTNLAVDEKLFIPGAKTGISEAVSRGSYTRFSWPTNGELSSPFGYRWGRLHAGIDIANDTGTVISAAREGKVIFSGWESGYGYLIMLDHGGGYVSLYGHLSELSVSKGEYVKTGQLIGYMGSSGNSTGSHLHFEVRLRGIPINPLSILP